MTASVDSQQVSTALADIERQGFAVVSDVLSTDEIAGIKIRLTEVARFERATSIDQNPKWEDGPQNQRVFGLLNKGTEFIALAEHPIALALMGALLDPAFLLSSLTANITGPGGWPMYLHYDQHYVPQPWPPSPLVANVIWMLDDFTEANGATRFVPGSHRQDHSSWTLEHLASANLETTAICGRAGSMVCLEGRVLHQTGANRTANELRHGVIAYYCQPWIRQQENASLSIRPDVWPTLSPTMRGLVGLKMYEGLGCVSGPTQRGFPYPSNDTIGS